MCLVPVSRCDDPSVEDRLRSRCKTAPGEGG
ncbi:hypothetical protein R2601_03943 [Salipiger bermudensis HTCC2601]|uniref:Uncharacterized protein n=1 Tax=Salipiger bermudensis (strain DSM 26914 / JCM 13377 / KCTC 12554 / HTCC2601) TaxID=314265 RepID=Q0FW57_SALBH|nr:hypothetical protein R2601_03943 [Salipiger bermudensis HTCC2601]